MASTYPATLDTLSTDKSGATSFGANQHSAHHNDMADAINKIEAELGTDPAGSEATVVARLDAVDTAVSAAQADADTGISDAATAQSAADAAQGDATQALSDAAAAQSTADAAVAKTSVPVVLGVAVSDETTVLTTGTAKITFRMPHAMTVTAVRASLTTASSSGAVTVDINEGAGAGTSILSTKLTIDANELTSTTAATPAVISDSALADDAQITVDIDGAGTDAAGLKIWLIGTRSVA